MQPNELLEGKSSPSGIEQSNCHRPERKKSLQRFTNRVVKYKHLLSLPKITNEDLNALTEEECNAFLELLTEKFKAIKGEERDKLWEKIEGIVAPITRNQMWENNHIQITQSISSFISEYGRMPSKSELAEKSGLSRQTIHKHFTEYMTHPIYIEELEQYRFMTTKLMAKLFQFALNGNIPAAKLYLSMVGPGSLSTAPISQTINQNNSIQGNGIILTHELFQHLSTDQLRTIVDIFESIKIKDTDNGQMLAP